jgi:hypothetical protein
MTMLKSPVITAVQTATIFNFLNFLNYLILLATVDLWAYLASKRNKYQKQKNNISGELSAAGG